MKNKLAFLLIAAVMACSGLAGCSAGGAYDTTQKVEASKLNEMTVHDIEGNDIDFGEYLKSGKVTMVNIWGTFCGPCLSEMPDIEKLYKKYHPQGLNIIGMTCDIYYNGQIDKQTLQDARDIKSELGITYPLAIETPGFDELLTSSAVPTTYFLDSDGNLLGSAQVGSRSESEWESIIKEYLK